MASSKEFKQAIREGRLNDGFIIAMGNAPQLHITTWIASAQDNPNQPRGGECLRTHVNLVEGEIVNEIGENLIGDDLYANLQQFHLEQVTQGHQTISQNLQSLQQMFRLLAILQKQQNGEEYRQIKTWKIADNSLPPIITNRNPDVNSSEERSDFSVPSNSDNLPLPAHEPNEIVDNLLSFDELEIEINRSNEEQKTETVVKKDEDWGDWLNEDQSEVNSQLIDLEDLDLDEDEPEEWQEDWGDETEFIANTSIENGTNQPQDQQ